MGVTRLRVPLFFRCSDAAYEKLDLDRSLRSLLAELETETELTLRQPRAGIGRLRKRRIETDLMKRLDAIVARRPVSRDKLVREAIYRATGKT